MATLYTHPIAAVALPQAQGSRYSSDNFTVKALQSGREVVAVLEVEDGASLELVVRLHPSTPLRAPDVECRWDMEKGGLEVGGRKLEPE